MEARLAEIELKKAEEQIISVVSHSEVIEQIVDQVRAMHKAIPSKTAPSLSLKQKQVVCKEILKHDIRESLSELAKDISDDKHFNDKEGPEITGSKVYATTEVKRNLVVRPKTVTVN